MEAVLSDRPKLSKLFLPLKVGDVEFANRIIMPPMGTGLASADGMVTDATAAYYRRRARGGVGGICVEASLIAESLHGVGPEIRLHHDRFLPGLRSLVNAVHEMRVPIGIQLWHPGRQTTIGVPVGPSPVPLSRNSQIPRELSVDEIHRVQTDYAESALRCREAGFDWVEIHSAHCYLPCEFLSPLANQREDEYGGSLAGRARFLLEVVDAIRNACGADYPVFVRLSGSEGVEGGGTLEEAAVVAGWLEQLGVACISVSAGSWNALELTIPPMSMDYGCLLPYARAIKQAVSIPVMAAGRLDIPELAQHVLETEGADLIGIGRGLIADPDWPRKAASGDTAEIRPCIACNACVELVARAEAARCAVNPEVGRDETWAITRTSTPRHIMVVGAGPAGMEAARVSRLRGHNVSLWERDASLGGKLDAASRAPSKSNVLRFRDYQAHVLAKLGVEVHLGADVTADTVAEQKPDAVIIATGAEPMLPPIPGIDGAVTVDAVDILLGRARIEEGEMVAIIGGSATGCETAEVLLGVAAEITIIEMLPRLGRGVEQITRKCLLSELREGGVRFQTRSKVTLIGPGRVEYVHSDEGKGIIEVDRVVLAAGWTPAGAALAARLNGYEVQSLGDAVAAGDFVAAVNAGADAGLAV